MKHLVRLSVFLLILCAGTTLAMAQSTVKQTPDDAKIEHIQAQADDALSAKMEAYRQKMGFADVVPNFVPTGDPVVDRSAYQIAKSEWISKDPAAYDSYIDAMTVERPTDPTTVTASPTAKPE